jgi:hypothetical protein
MPKRAEKRVGYETLPGGDPKPSEYALWIRKSKQVPTGRQPYLVFSFFLRRFVLFRAEIKEQGQILDEKQINGYYSYTVSSTSAEIAKRFRTFPIVLQCFSGTLHTMYRRSFCMPENTSTRPTTPVHHASFPVSLVSESETDVSIVPVQQPLTTQEIA